MSSGYFIDSQDNYDKSRSRHEVLSDFRLHEWVKDELSGDFSTREELEEGLSDDKIYFIEKNYYHTPDNVDPGKAHKVNAGPAGEGRAGDFDVGRIDIPTGKITKIELKSPGRIPAADERSSQNTTYDCLGDAHEQNEYLAELLANIEDNQDITVPYSSRVRAWNDIVDKPVRLDKLPDYSGAGSFLCTPEAKRRAQQSERVQVIDDSLFKGWMFGGGEDILQNIDALLEE